MMMTRAGLWPIMRTIDLIKLLYHMIGTRSFQYNPHVVSIQYFRTIENMFCRIHARGFVAADV